MITRCGRWPCLVVKVTVCLAYTEPSCTEGEHNTTGKLWLGHFLVSCLVSVGVTLSFYVIRQQIHCDTLQRFVTTHFRRLSLDFYTDRTLQVNVYSPFVEICWNNADIMNNSDLLNAFYDSKLEIKDDKILEAHWDNWNGGARASSPEDNEDRTLNHKKSRIQTSDVFLCCSISSSGSARQAVTQCRVWWLLGLVRRLFVSFHSQPLKCFVQFSTDCRGSWRWVEAPWLFKSVMQRSRDCQGDTSQLCLCQRRARPVGCCLLLIIKSEALCSSEPSKVWRVTVASIPTPVVTGQTSRQLQCYSKYCLRSCSSSTPSSWMRMLWEEKLSEERNIFPTKHLMRMETPFRKEWR